ncbi:MAG: LamG domain-containing protein [Opitutales bacterium]
MPTYIRVKDLPNSASSLNADDYIMLSGSIAGARKIVKADFLSTVADEFNASPSTYKLATLDASNKVDSSQWPASAFSYQGTWAASSNTPTLANGTGTAGYTYYASDSGSVNFGAGAISFTAGDAVVYDGSIWQKVPDVANILDGKGTVDEGKTTLQIPNVGTAANEVPVNGMLGDLAFQSSAGVVVDDLTVDGHFTGTVGKPMPVNGPSMRFDGSNDYIEFADNDSFSFVDGSGNDTPFSISAWVKMEDATSFPVISKLGAGASLAEYMFGTDSSDRLQVAFMDSSGQLPQAYSAAVTNYEGQWVHLVMTYGGAGPSASSGKSFATSITDNVSVYVNASAQALTAVNKPAYLGMSNTSQPVSLGSQQTNYAKGEIRDVKLFNKELSAAEVKEVYSNGQLPESFAELTGAIAYVSDFTTGVNGWNAINTTLTANYDSGDAGYADALRIVADDGSYDRVEHSTTFEVGKRYRLTLDYKMVAGTTGRILQSGNLDTTGISVGSWTHFNQEWVAASNDPLRIYVAVTGSASDEILIQNVRITQIGSVLDARAEQFDTSTGKLYDLSGNSFIGTQSGGVSLLGREFLIPERGIFTPTIYYQNSTGLSISYTTQSGNYVRTGDLVAIQIKLTWTVTGTPVNDNLGVRGIPFQPVREDSLACHDSQGQTALVTTNASNDIMYCLSNSLASNLADNVGTGTHTIYISGTYQIQ